MCVRPYSVAWIFTEGTARVETRARLEAQLAFASLVRKLPGVSSPSRWLSDARQRIKADAAAAAARAGPRDDDDDIEMAADKTPEVGPGRYCPLRHSPH
jgi:hypothetical protein